MIKYLELTAPETMELRGAKIIRTVVAEGDTVKKGDVLFTIMNNGKEEPLPASIDGRVVELIARDGDGVSLLTPLVLFETNVEAAPKASSQQTVTSAPARDKNIVTVKVPDIGGDAAKVAEILVKVGDHISVDDAIVSLESDKASMEVPSTAVGTVHAIKVALDDAVKQGDALIEVRRDAARGAQTSSSPPANESTPSASAAVNNEEQEVVSDKKSGTTAQKQTDSTVEVSIPDIGGGSAKVVEILVKVGDTVTMDDGLISLESDKASMEVPSSAAGEVVEIKVKLDDEVSEGTVVVILRSDSTTKDIAKDSAENKSQANSELSKDDNPAQSESKSATDQPKVDKADTTPTQNISATSPTRSATGTSHAAPSVRRLARELGAQLEHIQGSGRKERITKDDVKAWVKQRLQAGSSANDGQANNNGGAGIPSVKNPDFSKFGAIKREPLNRIKKLTAQNLHRSWLNVPHVTHNDEANIADLESFRKQLNEEYAKANKPIKLSPLAFIVKAVVNALQKYPQFNSSLSEDGSELILKQYFNIGIAVDTPDGLVVPVIKGADTLSVADIAVAMGELADKARDKKLSMADMSGACFTISSLGGIGGTGFTPIVNAPEVAILGVSRTKVQPHWNGTAFIPAPILPLSLSYDHRVIDGAEAARFTRQIASVLEDVRRLTV